MTAAPFRFGPQPIADKQLALVRLGALQLWAERRPFEWRVHVLHANADAEQPSFVDAQTSAAPPPEALCERYVASEVSSALVLEPRLGERAFVARPEHPLHLLPSQTIVLYITTPLWVAVRFGAGNPIAFEVPTSRPSDTWFGDLTGKGELCYAARTRARLELAELEESALRATTAVEVKNLAEESLVLERIKLPIPNLELYQDTDGRFWTSRVTLTRRSAGSDATLERGKGAPALARGAERAAPAREEVSDNALVRVFEAWGL
jgi:hypothetical protein